MANYRRIWRPTPALLAIIGSFMIAACTPLQDSPETRAISDRAEAEASAILQVSDTQVPVIQTDQTFFRSNPVYGRIAAATLARRRSSEGLKLQSAQLQREALARTLYPQFSPELRVDSDGNPALQLGVSQLIFSNGRIDAQESAIRAREITALADFISDSSQSVSAAITAYLDARLYARRAAIYANSVKEFETLIARVESRVAGGIADATELASFQLQLLEAQSDIAEQRASQSQAQTQLSRLVGSVDLPDSAPAIMLNEASGTPPLLLAALAAHQLEVATLDLERAQRRPRVALEGTASVNERLDTTGPDFGLSVGLDLPVGFGTMQDLGAQELAVEAAQIDIETTELELEDQLTALQTSISQTTARLPALRRLVDLSRTRLADFETQFQSGTVSIEEAITVIDTLQGAELSLIDAQDSILRGKLEIANIGGQLVPLVE